MNIKTPLGNNAGLFSICNNAKIKNLTLDNATVEGQKNVGILAGNVNNETEIKNIHITGSVKGEDCVGGIVGNLSDSSVSGCSFDGEIQPLNKISVTDEDNDFFQNVYEPLNIAHMGGIAGIALFSDIKASEVTAKIAGNSYLGGVAGFLRASQVSDCYINPTISGKDRLGAVAGLIQQSIIKDSYINTELYPVGKLENSDIQDCLLNVKGINENVYRNWDKEIWNIDKSKMPRLKYNIQKSSPLEIFLQDIRYDVLNQNIHIQNIHCSAPETVDIQLPDMEKPLHYDKNNEVLDEIRKSKDSKHLARLFSFWTDGYRWDFNPADKEHDEILLEIVKNPYFQLSERYESGSGAGEAIFCTPLYVLSRLNKGYVFREALKREDINPYVKSGSGRKTDIFKALYYYPVPTNMLLLFDSKNPIVKKYVQQCLQELPAGKSQDFITEILCKEPIGTIKYDEKNNNLNIPIRLLPDFKAMEDIHIEGDSKFDNIYDVMKSPDIPIDYKDSRGNTIAHILPELYDIEQIQYLHEFYSRGGRFNTRNKDGKTPLQIAMEKQAHNLYTEIALKKPDDAQRVDIDGNNVIMLNTKYNSTQKSLQNIDRLHKMGFSINVSDSANSSALIEAIKNNDIYKVNYLLSNGTAVDVCDENGQTPLHHAFIQRNTQIIKWLLDQYAYPCVRDSLGNMPKDYWKDCQAELLKSGIDIEAIEKEYELSFQSSGLDSEILKNTSNRSRQPLNDPYYEDLFSKFPFLKDTNNIKDVFYNLHYGIDYRFSDNRILKKLSEYLIQTYNPYALEVISELYKSDLLDINKPGILNQTLLTTAIKSYNEAENIVDKICSMKFVKFLLDKNANIDIADDNMQTSLHHCVFTNNLILFSEFLGKHPNINATDILGKNPPYYLGEDFRNPMRIIFEKYAEKRKIALPEAMKTGVNIFKYKK